MDENEDKVRALLRGVTYRPGWELTVESGFLRIRAVAIDTDDFSRSVPVAYSCSIPLHVYEDFDWHRWIFDQLMEVERHEAQEFFKVHGVKIYDPHREAA